MTVSSSPEISSELSSVGVRVDSVGLVTFVVDEEDSRWPNLRQWITVRGAVDVINTTFSTDELSSAPWLELVPDWHHGYPQPEQSFQYLEETYDLSGYCPKCGVGLRQVAPFLFKREPKWGRNQLLQVHWVFDEFFTTPEVWSTVFEPFGIGFRPVLTPGGNELKNVVQLVSDIGADVSTSGLTPETCVRCGRTKYLPATRGCFPALTGDSENPVVKTQQWFGSDASAHHCVLVAQEVRRALSEAGVRGASFRPVAM